MSNRFYIELLPGGDLLASSAILAAFGTVMDRGLVEPTTLRTGSWFELVTSRSEDALRTTLASTTLASTVYKLQPCLRREGRALARTIEMFSGGVQAPRARSAEAVANATPAVPYPASTPRMRQRRLF